jgi:predicted metal-binding protein
MDEKDRVIQQLMQDIAKWKGRAIEAAETACQLCKQTDLELCKHCRMEKIRKEAGH